MLFTKIEAVHKGLARYVSGFGASRRSLQVDTDAVREALPHEAALVEYLRFAPLVAGGLTSQSKAQEDRYAAVVIPSATRGGEPVCVDLGPSEPIDAAVERFRVILTVEPEGNKKTTEVARELYGLLLAPLETVVAEADTLVLSPDSQLHFVCFEPLLDPSNRMACEKWDIRMCDTGRDFLEQGQGRGEGGTTALLIGDAAFDAENAIAVSGIGAAIGDSGDRGRFDMETNLALGLRADISGVSFGPLPGTREEVEALESALEAAGCNAQIFAGEGASESVIREQVEDRRIIHLATHGFFLNEFRVRGEESGRTIGAQLSLRRSPAMQDPMIRSGLALAGANQTLDSWKEGRVPEPSSDGILSAAEAVSLDLAGTELVVLSACETARGEALDGEGIYGLRRALKLAGTDSVVLTLWPIADGYTVGFMEDFYSRFLAGHHPAVALAETKKEHLVRLRAKYDLESAIRLVGPFIATGKGVGAVGQPD